MKPKAHFKFRKDKEMVKQDVKMKLKPLDLDEWKKEFDGAWDYDILKEKRQIFISKTAFENLKQRIKQACEFYLRYKDNPELLLKECFNLDLLTEEWEVIKFYCEEVLDKLENSFYDDEEVISQYNEWLFKLAFNICRSKDVYN